MASENRNHIKVFVSSTVYDFEATLNKVFATLSAIPYYTSKEETTSDGKVVTLRKPNLVVHPECVELYRLAIQNHIRPASERIGNWAQPYIDETGLHRHCRRSDHIYFC